MASILKQMAKARVWAFPVTRNTDIVVVQGNPLYTVASTYDQLLTQCRVAAQGSGSKSIVQALAPNPLADVTIDLTTIKSFGVRVKIADSLNNFKYGAYDVKLQDGATVLGEVYIRAATNVVDVILLGISNVGGSASIISIAHPEVLVVNANSSLAIGNSIVAETLNERDLGLSVAGLC